MEKLPRYNVVINDNDETGLEFNSLVETPAHGKSFIMFSKDTNYFFDEKSKTIIGCAIAADEDIYRNSDKIGEHYVTFSKEEIKKIVVKLSKQGIFNSVNTNHDKAVGGIFLTGLFQIDKQSGVLCPEKLANQSLKDGSLITIYHVENQEIINKINKQEFNGFSIEGIFEKVKLNNEKMKNLFEKFKKKEVFAEATTDDGTKLTWEGELTIGETIIMVVAEDGSVAPAPAKDYLVSSEEGTFTLTVDEAGLLKDVQPVEAKEEAPSENEEVAAMKETIIKLKKENESILKFQKENEELKLQISKFNKDLGNGESSKSAKIDFFAMAQKIKNS